MKHLRLHKPWVGKEEVDAVQKVLESGWLTEGKVTEQFEATVASYVGAKYAVAVCNCTVALELALVAHGVHDNVVVPDFTHPATIRAVCNAGADPVLCDVDVETYNVVSYLDDYLVPVSWGGQPCLPVGIVEDAACSLGARIGQRFVGQTTTTCFSFHPRKLVTTGEGGMVVTSEREVAETIRSMKHFGYSNYKLSDINSAIGLEQMKKIDEIITWRIAMAAVYNDLLEEEPQITAPWKHPSMRHTYQTYAVYLNNGNRDEIIQKLAKQNIETQVGAYALHLLPRYTRLRRYGKLENSEKLHHNLLALPMAYDLTEEDQHRVVSELKNAVA